MHIQDFFQNFLKLFLVGLHGDYTISLIAQDMPPLKSYQQKSRCNNFDPKRMLGDPSMTTSTTCLD